MLFLITSEVTMNPGQEDSVRVLPRLERHLGGAKVVACGFLALQICASVAQQAPPVEQQPEREASQQPGQGAQVRTGTASGFTLDARLQGLLADHQYTRVAAELDQLPEEDARLYRGVLANHSNDLKKSIELLEPLADQVSASGDVPKEKLLRETLAEDYLRSGELNKAAAAYRALEVRLGTSLTPEEQDAIELPVKLLPLAKDNPPTTIEACDPFTLQFEYDPLGLMKVPVFVDAVPKSWMLDPTAPFNLMDRTTAAEVGLKVSAEMATIHTLTGKPIQVHMTVVPRFTIGGRLTLHNMTVFVYDDADYAFPRTKYHVEGVLGFPGLSALGSITVTDHATIQVNPTKKDSSAQKNDSALPGAPFYLDGEQIIVALGKVGESAKASDDDRMFAVDAGGQQTYLTARYFAENAAEFNDQKLSEYAVPGQQSQPSYVAETVQLRVANSPVELHYVPVLTQPLGSAALDDVYGVLGLDALGQFRSYTFDYRTMRFSVEREP
jgi:Aspartyl protease